MNNPQKTRDGGKDTTGQKSSDTNGNFEEFIQFSPKVVSESHINKKFSDLKRNSGLVSEHICSIIADTQSAGQSTSKFRERWMKSKLETRASVRKPNTEEKDSTATTNGTQLLRHFLEFETAALKTYKNTMAQLQTDLAVSVRLSSFSRFDQVAKTLATVQFERDAKQEIDCTKISHYDLALQQLSTKLEQMHHQLSLDLMKESTEQVAEVTQGHLLDGPVDLRQIEEKRRADEVQARREQEERKLLQIGRQLEEQEAYRHQEERRALEAKRSPMEAKKQLQEVEMKRKEEERIAENAKRTTSEVKKNLELLEMQLVKAARNSEEIGRKQTEIQKTCTVEKRKNYGHGTKSNTLERLRPTEAGIHKEVQTPGATTFAGRSHECSNVSKHRDGAGYKQPLIGSTDQSQEEPIKELTVLAEHRDVLKECIRKYEEKMEIISDSYASDARFDITHQTSVDAARKHLSNNMKVPEQAPEMKQRILENFNQLIKTERARLEKRNQEHLNSFNSFKMEITERTSESFQRQAEKVVQSSESVDRKIRQLKEFRSESQEDTLRKVEDLDDVPAVLLLAIEIKDTLKKLLSKSTKELEDKSAELNSLALEAVNDAMNKLKRTLQMFPKKTMKPDAYATELSSAKKDLIESVSEKLRNIGVTNPDKYLPQLNARIDIAMELASQQNKSSYQAMVENLRVAMEASFKQYTDAIEGLKREERNGGNTSLLLSTEEARALESYEITVEPLHYPEDETVRVRDCLRRQLETKRKECEKYFLQQSQRSQEEMIRDMTEKAEGMIEEKLTSYSKGIQILPHEVFVAFWKKARDAVMIQLELDLMSSKKLPPLVATDMTEKVRKVLAIDEAWQKRSVVNQQNEEKIRRSMERFVEDLKDRTKDINGVDHVNRRRIDSKKNSVLTDFRLSFTCMKEEDKTKLMKEMEEKLDQVITILEDGQPKDESTPKATPVHGAGKKLTQLERLEIQNRWKRKSQLSLSQVSRDLGEESMKQQTKGDKSFAVAREDRTGKVKTHSDDQLHLSRTILMNCLHRSVYVYHTAMKELQVGALSERLASFSDCDKAARKQATVSTFKDFVRESKVTTTPLKLYESYENELQKLLDKACHERRKALVNEERVVKAKEEEERVRIEAIRRRKRQESEGKRNRDLMWWEAEMKAKEEESAKQKEELSAPINVFKKEVRPEQTENDERKLLPRQEFRVKANRPCESSTDAPAQVPIIPETSRSIPSAELAIHIGLNRTRVGYVLPTTGTFFIVADVENCLYLKRNEFVVAFTHDDVKKLGNAAVDFKGSILYDSPHKLYTVINEERQFHLRLQEILARFFLCLRCEAEMVLKKYFRKCVIAVPQCLNLMQRCCIEDGATISGFEGIQFVNDTNAIAVAYFVDSDKKSGNVVVVNGSEESFDVASFDFSSSKLQCLGVTGNYFYPDVALQSWSVRMVNFFQNPIQRHLSKNELSLDPTSPDTTYLMLDGFDEMFADYLSVVSKLTAGREDGIIHMDSHAVVKGAAYLCCLRSRDPSNVILQVWTEKLHAQHATSLENLLREVEERITSQENRIKKVSKNGEKGGALTTNEVRQKRESLSLENVSTIHNAKMDLLNAMAKLEMELPTLHPNFRRVIYESRLEKVQEQLFLKEDLTLEQLHKMKEEIMKMFVKAAA